LTAPSKLGSGYGYPNITIGKSYEYQSDPYERRAQLEKTERAEHKKRNLGGKAFVPSSCTKEYFNAFAGLPRNDEGISKLIS
jgi:hypothetical protein